MKEIKKYKPMIWVKVSTWNTIQTLNYEGTKEEFIQKISSLDPSDYVYFPIHDQLVARSQIKEIWSIQPDKLSKETKLSSLTETQRANVKERIANMKRNLNREPTDSELDNMIRKELWQQIQEDKFIPLSEVERFKTSLQIKKWKISKIVTWSYTELCE